MPRRHVETLVFIAGAFSYANYWSSSEYDANNAWNQNFNNGNQNNNNKNNTFSVRPVRDFKHSPTVVAGGLPVARLFFREPVSSVRQLSFQDLDRDTGQPIALAELYEAYGECRRHKRQTHNALAFELDYEANLARLCDDINTGRYQPGCSIAFIVDRPVKREIFAADFRDRIVHHLIIRKLNPLFERTFIHDSYACRTGKGTHFGVRRVERFIRQCSCNYRFDAYVLKLDIRGFFMHIDQRRLFARLERFIGEHYRQGDAPLLLELCQKVIFNEPARHCVIKGKRRDWRGLPPDKSLFHAPRCSGLPIGNLTSQIFANFYLNPFDHYIKHDLGVRYYGRYVDDFILVHPDRAYLQSLVPILRDTLQARFGLELHPGKIALQHYSEGVQFLGTIIKPHRVYIAKRTKGNFYAAIQRHNAVVQEHRPAREQEAAFLSSMNAYLGLLGHYQTYRLRQRLLFRYLSGWWWDRVSLAGGVARFVMNRPR